MEGKTNLVIQLHRRDPKESRVQIQNHIYTLLRGGSELLGSRYNPWSYMYCITEFGRRNLKERGCPFVNKTRAHAWLRETRT